MALPVTAAAVRRRGALTPQLFNLTLSSDLDTLCDEQINFADSWMRVHMGPHYALADAASMTLQEEGQACLALERLTDILKAQKAYGTHFPYVSEDSPAYQALIDLNWGEKAMAALDTWVTTEAGGQRAFALPLLLVTSGPSRGDPGIESMSEQLSEELDFARGISNPDVGTLRK